MASQGYDYHASMILPAACSKGCMPGWLVAASVSGCPWRTIDSVVVEGSKIEGLSLLMGSGVRAP